MIIEAIGIGIIVGQYIYHRLNEESPPPHRDRIQIPKIEEGDVVPLLFGKVRVRQPLVAFSGSATAVQRVGYSDGFYTYSIDILFVLGIPFSDGATGLEAVYFGDEKGSLGFFGAGSTPPPHAPNIGGTPTGLAESIVVDVESPHFATINNVEFANGLSTQSFVTAIVAGRMIAVGIDAGDIPSMRGYATVYGELNTKTPALPSISWELSTYPAAPLLAFSQIGVECNPADVLLDLISQAYPNAPQLGKFGIANIIDAAGTFMTAAQTLFDEGHGYSRVIDRGQSADEIIQEILRQIDGVLYQDQSDGLIKLKLIRADYDPRTIPQINVGNCQGLMSFAASGWTNVVNKIRVVFTDRSRSYLNGSAVAHNQANAVGQDGEVNEIVLHYPGVCTQELADAIAGRELAARSRPLAKFTAIVDRTFYRVSPGDAVAVSWPDANISSMIFRVGRVGQGTADSNMIQLDLIQDYFYVHRSAIIDPGGQTGVFPGQAYAV